MPTYAFRCPRGHEFEKFFPTMNDRRRLKCPKCGQMAERQISGGTGLHFKGSGFYITDYKRSSAPAGESESKPDSKPESKPESKAEPKPDKPKPPKPKDK
jgi:putative FmdB family regulatory protein